MIGEIGNFKMKKLLLILFIIPAFINGQCISGDCTNGYGTFKYQGEFEGDSYVGEWESNLRHGRGTYTWLNGDKFEGICEYGKLTDEGKISYSRRVDDLKNYKYMVISKVTISSEITKKEKFRSKGRKHLTKWFEFLDFDVVDTFYGLPQDLQANPNLALYCRMNLVARSSSDPIQIEIRITKSSNSNLPDYQNLVYSKKVTLSSTNLFNSVTEALRELLDKGKGYIPQIAGPIADNYNPNAVSNDTLNEKYEQLLKLSKLKDAGVLSEKEFVNEKNKILGLTIKSQTIITTTTNPVFSSVNINIPTNIKVKNRYALVIGNEDYTSFQRTLNSEQNVDYAVNDATIFKKYCLKTLGVKEENMFFLTNATAGQMSQEIDLVSQVVQLEGDKAELIVYYAGHGYPDEVSRVPYLIPVDISASNLSSGIKLDDLYKKLTNTNASKITIFLDACFTGGGRISGLVASRGVKVKPKEGTLNGNIVVFSASSEEQSSLPYHNEGHGIFTYFLLKKFQETKGNVSLGDLSEYLEKEVAIQSLKVNRLPQNPTVNTSQKIINDWRNWKF